MYYNNEGVRTHVTHMLLGYGRPTTDSQSSLYSSIETCQVTNSSVYSTSRQTPSLITCNLGHGYHILTIGHDLGHLCPKFLM